MEEYFIKEFHSFLRYQDFPGTKEPILFIHGLGCAGSFDYPQVAAQENLAEHRRILVDLLGAGYSDKPEGFDYSVTSHAAYLKTFLEDTGINDFILFGHSLGGPVAIELANTCKGKIRNLILSESNLDPSAEGTSSYAIAQFSEKDFVDQEYQKLITECQQSGSTLWAASLSNWLPSAAYRLSKCAVQGGAPSWRELLYNLPLRKSFIFGERSLPNEDYDDLQRHGIHLEVVPSAGHSMAWDNAKGLADAISRCIQTT